jgi:hypothetical protein
MFPLVGLRSILACCAEGFADRKLLLPPYILGSIYLAQAQLARSNSFLRDYFQSLSSVGEHVKDW